MHNIKGINVVPSALSNIDSVMKFRTNKSVTSPKTQSPWFQARAKRMKKSNTNRTKPNTPIL